MSDERHTHAAGKDPTRRYRGRRGVAPIAWTVAAWLALLVAWRAITDVDRPSGAVLYDPEVTSFVDVEGAVAPLYVHGHDRPDALLFVGDSRASAAISLRIFERETGEHAAILWNGFAQFDLLLRGVRELRARRLILCCTPAAVYAPPMKRMQWLLDKERSVRLTQRIDTRLDDELDVLRGSWLRPIDPSRYKSWNTADDGIQPNRQLGLYIGLMDKDSWEPRAAGFARLRENIVALQREGWSIACVRLPTERRVEIVEDHNFPPEQWATLCQELDMPYLDMYGGGYHTGDASHLLGADAERATHRIAEWARGIDWAALAKHSPH